MNINKHQEDTVEHNSFWLDWLINLEVDLKLNLLLLSLIFAYLKNA